MPRAVHDEAWWLGILARHSPFVMAGKPAEADGPAVIIPIDGRERAPFAKRNAMPRTVRKRHKGEKGKPWKVVEPGGKVVAQSDTRKKAEAAARAANRKR